MHNRKLGFWSVGLVLIMTVVTALGGLNICKKCGYENSDTAPKCTHCNAVFPGKDQPEPQQDDTDAAANDDQIIPLQIVNNEIEQGLKQVQNKNYELARFFFDNALALEGLTDPADHSERSEKLLQQIASTSLAARNVLKPCPRCSGSGKQQVKFEGLGTANSGTTLGSGSAFSQNNFSGIKCKKCGGTGTIQAIGTIDDMKFARGKAASEYRTLQQARRYEPLGGAWIPPHLVDTLTARQKATIMRSVVLPCEDCAGYGRQDCKRCDGLGRTECGKCDKGRVPYEWSEGDIKRVGENMTKPCPECAGTGTLPCKSCNEEGSVVCKDCGGSGEAEACNSCAGRGYITCKKCKGSKLYKDEPCPSCKSEGYILCTSCKGIGRRD